MGGMDEISRLRARIAELEAAAEINRLVCDQLPVMLWTTDRELTFSAMCGGDTGGALGTTIFEYFRTADPAFPPVAASLRALKGETVRYEHEWLGRRFSAAIAPLRAQDGTVTGTIGMAFDVTEQDQAEDALRSVDSRHTRLLESTSDMVFTLDLSGRFKSANRAAERVLGYSAAEFSELWLEDLAAPEAREIPGRTLQAILRSEDPVTFELALTTRSGERLAAEVTCSVILDRNDLPVSIQAVVRDTTHRKRIESQLRHVQALEGTALVASGVAEDLHDLLREILGSAYALKGRMREGGSSREAVSNVIDKAERASSLADHLVGMAQQSRRDTKLFDVHPVLRNMVALLTRTVDPKIRVVTAFDADRSSIIGDDNQIYQVFMNLAAAVRDALPEGGELQIGTSRNNRDLFVTIQGSGPGFCATADEPSRLGIAVARAIVRAHHGIVAMDAKTGSGCTFQVSLPVYASPGRRESQSGDAAEEVAGRVLVVDDDAAVRRVLSRMLEELGLEVAGTGGAREAIRLYAQSHDRIDAVVLDATMREMPGPECMAELRAIKPDVKIAVCTAGEQGERGPGVWWIEKPYSMSRLASVMRSVLGLKAARTA